MRLKLDERPLAGFFRRLGAAWVDLFFIYAVVSFLISVTAPAGIRLAFEPLYLVTAAIYFAAMVSRNGQTIGKMLLGISVARKTGGPPGIISTLVREVVGKWGIAVAIPLLLGRQFVGQAWVPTLFDLAMLLPVLVMLFAHYLIIRRPWYDWLAGTIVVRVPGRADSRLAFIVLVGSALLGVGSKATELALLGKIPCRLELYRSMHSISPYVEFLKRGHSKPVDYVMRLFDYHDVVVLCERAHPEMTQWDFIYELISDPRFIERVGRVFTEYGQTGMQAYLNDFLATDNLNESEIHDRAIHIMRHPAVWPVWTNTNWYNYLIRLYALNQTLPPEKRIRHYLTDVPVEWNGLTKDEYKAYRRSLKNRDEQMARVVIDEIERLALADNKKPKCLVVQNYRHAFDLTGRSENIKRRNTYEFLKDAFGDRAANVLINCNILVFAPIAGECWDAAILETGHQPVGFNFEGSPFGEDPFDLFPLMRGRLKYRDVFTGFVYTHALEDQYLQYGTPGYFAGFEDEALRRAEFVDEDYQAKINAAIEWEKEGDIPVKHELLGRPIKSLLASSHLGILATGLLTSLPWLLELFLLFFFGIGLLIGICAHILQRENVDDELEKAATC